MSTETTLSDRIKANFTAVWDFVSDLPAFAENVLEPANTNLTDRLKTDFSKVVSTAGQIVSPALLPIAAIFGALLLFYFLKARAQR